MNIKINEEPIIAAAVLAQVPIGFEVETVFDMSPRDGGLGGLLLSERRLDIPYFKDYDTAESEGPTQWSGHFDISKWGFIVARLNGAAVGGAVVAFNTEGVHMLEGRRDIAVLCPIRVSPGVRRQGIGSGLLRAVEAWAVARGCKQLKIETQNINVPACRFYARQGCVLGAINRFAYPSPRSEV